jgi:hypothetical protein
MERCDSSGQLGQGKASKPRSEADAAEFAAAWLVQRFQVSMALAATIAAHAGLGGHTHE